MRSSSHYTNDAIKLVCFCTRGMSTCKIFNLSFWLFGYGFCSVWMHVGNKATRAFIHMGSVKRQVMFICFTHRLPSCAPGAAPAETRLSPINLVLLPERSRKQDNLVLAGELLQRQDNTGTARQCRCLVWRQVRSSEQDFLVHLVINDRRQEILFSQVRAIAHKKLRFFPSSAHGNSCASIAIASMSHISHVEKHRQGSFGNQDRSIFQVKTQ